MCLTPTIICTRQIYLIIQRIANPCGADEATALLANDTTIACTPHQVPESSFPKTSFRGYQEEDVFDPWKQHCDVQYKPDNHWSEEEDDTNDDVETNTYRTTKIAATILAVGSVGFMTTRALMQDDDIDDVTGANTWHDGGTAQPHAMHVDANQATQGVLPQPLPDVTNAIQMTSTPPMPALSPAELQIVQQMATQAASNAASAAGSAASAVAGVGAAAIGGAVT